MISLWTDSELVERETSLPQSVEWFEINELALMRYARSCQQASHTAAWSTAYADFLLIRVRSYQRQFYFIWTVVHLLGLKRCESPMQKMMAYLSGNYRVICAT